MRAVLFLVILVNLSCLPAFSMSYTCQIEELYSVGSDGRLEKVYSNVDESLDDYDKKFHVDKRTGMLIGNKLENSRAVSVEVIPPTKSSRVLKVISLFDSGTLQTLQIFEHFEGKNKPFSLAENNMFRVGTCQ